MASPSDIRDPQTYAIIGAAMAVHRELGPGFLEHVYTAALRYELELRSVPATFEVHLPVYYRQHRLPVSFRLDCVCFETVIVEIKALKELRGPETAQVINYLKAGGRYTTGLLLNFGSRSLEYRRFVMSSAQSA